MLLRIALKVGAGEIAERQETFEQLGIGPIGQKKKVPWTQELLHAL